jgi:transposase-like protein
MDGIPFRKLADQYNLSPSAVYRTVIDELNRLPTNSWISAEYCLRWSQRLVVDGKYLRVKGYDKKIVFIYGIDYLTHDIPVGLLAPSENDYAFNKFFNLLKQVKYNAEFVVADDIAALKPALKRVFPRARLQLCHTHYLEGVRQLLDIRKDWRYRDFFNLIRQAFRQTIRRRRDGQLHAAHSIYTYQDLKAELVIADIMARYDTLFANSIPYPMQHCPMTTNIIESSNSHLEARLKSIKGFQSFQSAERWLNAWMLRRRTKAFTDCEVPFKHLNGKTSLFQTLKNAADEATIQSFLSLKKRPE